MTEQVGLDALNGDLNLDLSSAVYSNFYREFKDEYNISCTYCTEETSISQLKQKDSNDFILMSCNIQSFQSKKNEWATTTRIQTRRTCQTKFALDNELLI